MIDWTGSEPAVLLNPRMPRAHDHHLRELVRQVPELPGHVWVAASGSSGAVRMVALSRAAMLNSAEAVNAHVASSASDRWLCVLPLFHVGGLAIHARAHRSGASVISADWNAHAFVDTCAQQRITLSSLVPAQVNDLVTATLTSPPSLRAIFIGGGRLAPELLHAASRLGWRLLPSFGMTECASQIATASIDDLDSMNPPLVLLRHLRVRSESDGRLAFSGDSLLTGYATERDGCAVFKDPKQDGWFVSEDLGRVIETGGRSVVEVQGRTSDFIKIGGESTSIARLDSILEDVLRSLSLEIDAALIAMPDERLGHVVHLATSDPDGGSLVRERFDERVLPFERVRKLHTVPEIPRSSLGKVLRTELAGVISTLSPPGSGTKR